MNILLEPAGSYRISGRRGTHCHLTLQLLDAYPLIAAGQELARAGRHELQVQGRRQLRAVPGWPAADRRWWAMPAGAAPSWSARPSPTGGTNAGELIVERLDNPRVRNRAAHRALSRAAAYLEQITALWTDTYLKQLQQLPFKQPASAARQPGWLAGQQSVMGRFRLTPDQALVITVRASDAASPSDSNWATRGL